ncbi:ABC transporter family substrate-binding protein [Streptomyces sp. NPDC088794]|uniref:ABC transporter family substrate-binding protein n=1 Tax=Streptomyces sp. NPDC088794 TaxID=3365902 RepID=UPI00380A998F
MTRFPERRRFLWAVQVCVALAALLAGCTSSGGPNEPDDRDSRAAVPAYDRTDVNARPRSALRDGGTLTLSMVQWLTQFNYFQLDGSLDDALTVVGLFEPRLFLRDAKGVPHPVPDYLTSAKVTSTSPQTVVYRLNPKAGWSDGTALGWQDFAAQWRALGRGDQRYQIADPSGYEDIASVTEGADAHEVKVVFKTPFADWQRLFSPLYPAAAFSTPEEFNEGWRTGLPITAGPFKVGSLDTTGKTLTAVRDPKWWGTRPLLDQVVFRTLDPTTAVQAYLNGEISAVNAASGDVYDRLKGASGTDIRTGSAWDEVLVSFNGASGPLADPQVRRAVLRAVDRNALAKVAGEGLPIGVPLLGNHFFMTNQPGYTDNSGSLGSYDLKEAERILDERGWHRKNGSGTRAKDGQELKLRFVLSQSTNRLGLDLSQLIQQMLSRVGIAVEIQKVPADDYLSKYLNRGNFDLAIFRFIGQTYPSSLYSIYREPSGGQAYENYGRISSPDIDALLREAVHTLDPDRRARLYRQADAEIWEAAHDLLLYQRPQILAVREGLANYGVPGLGDIDFTQVGWER